MPISFWGAYEIWAVAQGTALNVVDWQRGEVGPHKTDRYYAILLFLQDEAVIWAFPAIEEFA
jgi:hypothetical protein